MSTDSTEVDFYDTDHCLRVGSFQEDGRPTTFENYRLLQLMRGTSKPLSYSEIADELNLHPKIARIMCRCMEHCFVLCQDPPNSDRFLWNRSQTQNKEFRSLVMAALSPDRRQEMLDLPLLSDIPCQVRGDKCYEASRGRPRF